MSDNCLKTKTKELNILFYRYLAYLASFMWIFWLILGLALLPTTVATQNQTPFPNIPFHLFSQFVETNFDNNVSLSTVLMVLFSLTDNPELLNLHFRQTHPVFRGENKVTVSSWLKALARGIQDRLGDDVQHLFRPQSYYAHSVNRDLAVTLNNFSECLGLTPYDASGNFQKKLHPVARGAIEPVQMLCPISMSCTTSSCYPRHLEQITKSRNIPEVTLIQGTSVSKGAYVLTGECRSCKTQYMADHESFVVETDNAGNVIIPKRRREVYLNSARFLKVGSNLWVDRSFSNAVINGMYSFHASANTYMQYWNNTFGSDKLCQVKIGRKHVWQTFIQESIRSVSAASQAEFETDLNLPIDAVVVEAFDILGEGGQIRAAEGHECNECTKPFKRAGGEVVPDAAPVKMVVMDGIVMGPTVSGFLISLLDLC